MQQFPMINWGFLAHLTFYVLGENQVSKFQKQFFSFIAFQVAAKVMTITDSSNDFEISLKRNNVSLE